MKIDIKSLIIGVLILVVVFLGLGAKQPTESHSCGRYQVDVGPNRAFIIDTHTGQVWEKFISSGQGPAPTNFGGPKQ